MRWRRALVVATIVGMAGQISPGYAEDGVELASGRVVDAAGRPIEGATVEVFLWPGAGTSVGVPVPAILVGSTTTGPDGTYVVVATDVGTLSDAAAANGGYANLELRIRKDALLFERFFVLPIAVSGGTAMAGTLRRIGRSSRGLSIRVKLAPRAPGVGKVVAASVEPQAAPCLTWVKSKELTEAWGVVGEIHRWKGAIPKNKFTYGATADSTFEVALNAGSGWYVGGTSHIGDTISGGSEAKVAVTLEDAATGYQVEAKFKRAEYSQVCTNNKMRKAYAWNGYDLRKGSSITGLDGHCGDTYAQYAWTFPLDQTGWARDVNEAHRWNQAISLGVLTVGGRSGYSTYVVSEWTFKEGVHKTLCGNDDLPRYAHRVFAGL